MSKLNPNAQKWVDALRSGKYRQGKDSLSLNGNLCCLGVLCEVAIENGVPIKKVIGTSLVSPDHYDGDSNYAPAAAREWVGLKTPQGYYSKAHTTLASQNDNGLTFSEIADLIEENAEELGVSA